jgi:predicted PurR-regulated permease PerM
MPTLRDLQELIRTRVLRRGPVVFGPPLPLAPPTPIYITPRTRLILLLLIGAAFYLIASHASDAILLLFMGAIVALVLSFPVRFLSSFLPRRVAITVVAFSTLLFAIVLLALMIPFAINEIGRFAESFPATVDDLQELTRDLLFQFYNRGWMEEHPDEVLSDIEAGIFDAGQQVVTDLLSNTVGWMTRSVNLLITTFGVIFVSIYLLADIPRFRDSFVRMWAPAYRDDAVVLWDTLGYSLSRYLSGLLASILIQGVAAFIGLTVLSVPYALLLGIWTSMTAILPYIGAFLGAIPAVAIALTISWQLALLTTLLFIVINQLEANFITPRIQGSAVRVHPLLIFFNVIAGSSMFGAIGAVMAVPTLAVLRVLGEFFWLRLRVREDGPTLLAAMRSDVADERLSQQPPIPEIVEEEAEKEIVKAAQEGRTLSLNQARDPEATTSPAP